MALSSRRGAGQPRSFATQESQCRQIGIVVTVAVETRAEVDWQSLTPQHRESRNRAHAQVVAAGEFGKRHALRPSSAGLGLLRVGQLRRAAHILPALLRPAAAAVKKPGKASCETS
jgi:hypothetical protein